MKLFSLVLVFGSLLACGKKDATNSAAKEVAAPAEAPVEEAAPAEFAFQASDLVGTWQTPCFPSPAGDGSFNQLTFNLTEAQWDLDYNAYGNAECTALFLAVKIQGPYSLEGASSAADGAREATFGFATKTVTAHMDPAVDVIKNACGFEEVAVGTPIDISGGCAGLGAYPIADCGQDYDIVSLTDNVLGFGARPADNNMCTKENRPTSFEGGAKVSKVVAEAAPAEEAAPTEEAPAE